MNRMTAVSMILGIIAAGTAVADSVGTVDVQRVTGCYSGWGGEYTICDTSLSLDAYADVARDQGAFDPSFQSFCVEFSEHIYPPEDNLDASLEEYAIEGGGGDHPDYIGPEVAWLYTQFATGNLAGYAYTGTVGGLTRVQTAGALQRLIWSLEDEGGGTEWDVDGAYGDDLYTGVYLNGAQLALIDTWETAYLASGTTVGSALGKVMVLNLEGINKKTGEYGVLQSQLYLSPVPVPGAVLLGSLGLAYAGLRLRRRCD